MTVLSLLLTLFAVQSVTSANPSPQVLDPRALNEYAPVSASCPSTQIVRGATNISSDEARYITSRKQNADRSLAGWLQKQGDFHPGCLPSVGFAASGGGYRALLEAAGVMQAFDARDTKASTGGLYQGFTYQAGLSGGAWFTSSLAGNNWPTVSYLHEKFWKDAFERSLLVPATLLKAAEYPEILSDLVAKEAAGFQTTIVDAYGQLVSYQLLPGNTGGDSIRMSGLKDLSNFTSASVPYPILTALGVDMSYEGQCDAYLNATQYEFHPYEWGSWDKGVSAFARTQYMGSNLTNGSPTHSGKCIEHYDNLGYILGTSSDVFTYALCGILAPVANVDEGLENTLKVVLNGSGIPQPLKTAAAPLGNILEAIVNDTSEEREPRYMDLFGSYPNPFYQYPQSTTVNQHELITMVDGGLSFQNVPVWPFIQPGRDLDVLIAVDCTADTDQSFPNGTAIRRTYLNAQAAGLTRMPAIPPAETFVSQGLNKHAVFFGCNDPHVLTLIWLPNVDYVYPSNQSTFKFEYTQKETAGMLLNGNAIATQNGTEGWGFCLACGIMNGKADLPSGCAECLEKYCYKSK
ncbi:Lysophospholipase 2 [Lecanosticta acicola]|uniref:Lysophospholipase n=1 Tax=Lecanosticta acicola TaxID=111012 RepID=A0AAI8YZE5_9PEZI|nr:Lysophospholipase 2 [Lecanosticta acicola]